MALVRWVPWWAWLLSAGLAAAVVVVAPRDDASAIAVVAGIGAVAVVGWSLARRHGRRLILDWRDAEYATAQWLEKMGCRHVQLTGGSADGGIDVITDCWGVQVKHTAKRVGRPAVQQLVGAALTLDRQPALFSTSGFTGPAFDYAHDHEVALFELGLDGHAWAVNDSARRLGRRGRRWSRGR